MKQVFQKARKMGRLQSLLRRPSRSHPRRAESVPVPVPVTADTPAIPMRLLDLPNELLLGIANALTAEKDLNALTRTNQLLYSLLNPLLYRNHVRTHGGVALLWAARTGQAQTAQRLLQHNPSVSKTTPTGERQDTPAVLAVAHGHSPVFTLLLAAGGVDPNETDTSGRSMLFLAAEHGHTQIVQILLSLPRIETDTTTDENSNTPLCIAAEKGHVGIVRLLIESGVDPMSSANGRAPIHYAAWEGHASLMEYLLALPAVIPDHPDSRGQTALGAAIRRNQTSVVKLLLARPDVNPAIIDIDGFRALTLAAEHGTSEIVKLILSRYPEELNAKDKMSKCALFRAAAATSPTWSPRKGILATITTLLNHPGIDPNVRDWTGQTPLLAAVSAGHTDIVRLLLGLEGVDVNARNRHGQTALSEAVCGNHEEIVRMLLAHGAVKVDCRDSWGRTPLLYARWNGTRVVERLLLESARSQKMALVPPYPTIQERVEMIQGGMAFHMPLRRRFEREVAI